MLILFASSATVFISTNHQDIECDKPDGSYTGSCEIVENKRYRSSDKNLNHMTFCIFEITCQRAKNQTETKANTITLPIQYIKCLQFFENFDGTLLLRDNEVRGCASTEEAIRQGQQHTDL